MAGADAKTAKARPGDNQIRSAARQPSAGTTRSGADAEPNTLRRTQLVASAVSQPRSQTTGQPVAETSSRRVLHIQIRTSTCGRSVGHATPRRLPSINPGDGTGMYLRVEMLGHAIQFEFVKISETPPED